jgi:5S rRNA maturation endonuclease (ribonuclease M5)
MFDKQEMKKEVLDLFHKIEDKNTIVEGKRDREVLCSFGLKKVETINQGIYEIAEKLEGKDVAILTDFDKEGRKIAKKLYIFLQSLNCKIDFQARKKLGVILKKMKIKTIEELKCLK